MKVCKGSCISRVLRGFLSSNLSVLNAGIRVFDLRYALDVTNSTLVFWHGDGLQSETATVNDVLFGK